MYKNDVYTKTLFTHTDGTTPKDIAVGGDNGIGVYEIMLNVNTSVATNIILFLYDGENDIPIKYSSVAAGIGMSNSSPDPLRFIQPSVNFLVNRVLDRDQNFCIPLPAGWRLRMRMVAALTNPQSIMVITQCKEF